MATQFNLGSEARLKDLREKIHRQTRRTFASPYKGEIKEAVTKGSVLKAIKRGGLSRKQALSLNKKIRKSIGHPLTRSEKLKIGEITGGLKRRRKSVKPMKPGLTDAQKKRNISRVMARAGEEAPHVGGFAGGAPRPGGFAGSGGQTGFAGGGKPGGFASSAKRPSGFASGTPRSGSLAGSNLGGGMPNMPGGAGGMARPRLPF